jgi:hypothetical protein
MSTVELGVRLSTNELLRAIDRLDTADLNAFVDAALALRARRHAPVLRQTEAQILQAINQGLSSAEQTRYTELIRKRQDETLTPVENQELGQITARVEALNVKRLELLAELAQWRGVSLPQLMTELGLTPPDPL